jgi:hypothetical protein
MWRAKTRPSWRLTLKRILKIYWIRIWVEAESCEEATDVCIPWKVGNWMSVSFLIKILQDGVCSCRWLACNRQKNNAASPLVSVAMQKTCLCVYQLKGSRDNVVSALTRLRAERSGVRILARIRDLSHFQNVLTGCGAQPVFCSKGTGVHSRSEASGV